jgi:hypothetical protein
MHMIPSTTSVKIFEKFSTEGLEKRVEDVKSKSMETLISQNQENNESFSKTLLRSITSYLLAISSSRTNSELVHQ